jgi:beta-lactamase regulating signal transducer with metallopeptidase domain
MTSMLLVQRLLTASIETSIAALVVLTIGALFIRRAPRIVALLWLVVLVKPLVTLTMGAMIPVPLPRAITVIPQRVSAQEEVTRVLTHRGPVTRARTESISRDPNNAIAAIWLTGVALLLGHAVYHRQRLHAIVAKTRPPSPRIAGVYARFSQDSRSGLPLFALPSLRVSDALDGPAIAGILQPVIVIPAWMDESADDAQLQWTLRHELRHASARDTLAIALRELAVIALWFHPLIWVAAAKWEAATELACDRDVVVNDVEAVDYADALYRTLLNVRQQRRLQLATGLFATRSNIGTRIAALVERPLAPRIGPGGMIAAAIVAIGLLTVGAGLASPLRGHHRGDLEERNDGQTITLRYDLSEIDFDGSHIKSLSPGGFVVMSETAGGTTRELRIESSSRTVIRTYRVDGRAAPPDDAFERTLIARLRRAIR